MISDYIKITDHFEFWGGFVCAFVEAVLFIGGMILAYKLSTGMSRPLLFAFGGIAFTICYLLTRFARWIWKLTVAVHKQKPTR